MSRAARMSSLSFLISAAALAGVIGWELTADRDVRPPEPESAQPASLPSTATKVRTRDEVADKARTALARPLFQPDRRPSTVPPSPLAAAETLPRLTALLSGPFGRRAIFAGADGRSMAVEEGAALGGWTVVSIGPEGVSVTGRDGARIVSLGRGAGAPAVVQTPVVAADVDEHESGGILVEPKGGPMLRYPGDPPAGRR